MNVQKKIAIGLVRAKLNSLAIINRKKAGEEAFRLFCTPLSRSKKRSPVFEQAEILQLAFQGNQLRGYRFNTNAGKRALILHGFTSGAQHFDQYIAPLMAKGYEIIAFDAPAHGGSEGKTVNALEYSRLILAIHDKYGAIDAYISHSFGGLALSLALEQIPHHPGIRAVFIAPATETTTAIKNAFMMLGITNPTIKKALEDTILNVSGKEAEWFSVSRAIKNIRASVLWLHDEEDDTTPYEDALKVQERQQSNVQFLITKGLGHSKIYKTTEIRDEVINFLR